MRKAALLPLILIAASSLALAGGGRGGGERGDRMARMQEHLGLSDAQVEQMREIRENGGSREDMRAVLTDEQRTLIEEHRAQRRERHGGKGGRGYGPPPGEDTEG